MRKIVILVVVLMVVGIGFLSGCMEQIRESLNPPDMEVISQYKREAYEGMDRVGYVDITVKNYGGEGSSTVYVKVTQGSNQRIKEQTVTLNSGESSDLSFRFSEIEFWTTEPWDFTVWVE